MLFMKSLVWRRFQHLLKLRIVYDGSVNTAVILLGGGSIITVHLPPARAVKRVSTLFVLRTGCSEGFLIRCLSARSLLVKIG